jgi:hypothetical protein
VTGKPVINPAVVALDTSIVVAQINAQRRSPKCPSERMLQLYRGGKIVKKPTGDTVIDKLLLTQRSSSRHYPR